MDWGLVCSDLWTGGGWKTGLYQSKKPTPLCCPVVGRDRPPGAPGIQWVGLWCLNKASVAFQDIASLLFSKVALLLLVAQQLPVEGLIIVPGEE